MSKSFQEFVAEPPVGLPAQDWQWRRVPVLLGFEGELPLVLARMRVVLLGAGSINRPVAEMLARLGVGRVDIVDPKRIKHESLLTHVGVRPDELGDPKALAAARACASLGTGTRAGYVVGRFQDLGPDALAGADAVIMAPDNLVAERAAGEICLHLGLPLFHASVHGDTLVVQIRVYRNAGAGSPTPACGFSADERAMMDGQVSFSCEGSPAAGSAPEVDGPPTVSPASLCSHAASMVVTQFLRFALGLGESVADTMTEWTGFTHRTRVSPLVCKGNCPCDHARFEVRRLDRPLSDFSVAELSALGGAEAGGSVIAGGLVWAERGACRCGRYQALGRFVDPERPRAGACPRCREPIHCSPFFLHRQVSTSLLEPVCRERLETLAEHAPSWFLARGEHTGTLFLNPEPKS